MNKTDKPLARQKKREDSNQKWNIKTSDKEIKRIIRDYYEQLYVNELYNLE